MRDNYLVILSWNIHKTIAPQYIIQFYTINLLMVLLHISTFGFFSITRLTISDYFSKLLKMYTIMISRIVESNQCSIGTGDFLSWRGDRCGNTTISRHPLRRATSGKLKSNRTGILWRLQQFIHQQSHLLQRQMTCGGHLPCTQSIYIWGNLLSSIIIGYQVTQTGLTLWKIDIRVIS